MDIWKKFWKCHSSFYKKSEFLLTEILMQKCKKSLFLVNIKKLSAIFFSNPRIRAEIQGLFKDLDIFGVITLLVKINFIIFCKLFIFLATVNSYLKAWFLEKSLYPRFKAASWTHFAPFQFYISVPGFEYLLSVILVYQRLLLCIVLFSVLSFPSIYIFSWSLPAFIVGCWGVDS